MHSPGMKRFLFRPLVFKEYSRIPYGYERQIYSSRTSAASSLA